MISTTQPPSGTMKHIPLEVQAEISKYLDLPSALSLCRTSKALRDAGEMSVYHAIDLTSGWDPSTMRRHTELDVQQYRTRAATVSGRFEQVLAAIRAYPPRRGYIRALRLEPADGAFGTNAETARAYVGFLAAVEPQLRQLDILPLPYGTPSSGGPYPDISYTQFFLHLNQAHLNFPRLVKLKYALGGTGWHADGIDPVDGWVRRLANLEELEYCSANPDGYPSHPLPMTSKPFKHLKRVSVDHLDDAHPDMDYGQRILTTLLELAPNAELVRVGGMWYPRRKDSALKALLKLEYIKTLAVLSSGIRMRRIASMRFDHLVMSEPAWTEDMELEFASLPIPSASHLRRLTVLTPPAPPLSEYITSPVGKAIAITRQLTSNDMRRFKQNPQLHTILYLYLRNSSISTYTANAAAPEYWADPVRWEAEGHRGFVLRQYDALGADDKEKLWHIRALSRARAYPSGPRYVGIGRSWSDYTHYMGRIVPWNILEKVYEASGLTLESVEGGRDLELGENSAGWDILREWRAGLGDDGGSVDEEMDEELFSEYSEDSETGSEHSDDEP